MLKINENPSLDEIWDFCVRNLLYNTSSYLFELISLFKKIGITKESRIADISAGGGFPAINLIGLGYRVDCFDGYSENIFNANAKKCRINARCKKMLWNEIPMVINRETYDFIFCRGNSFIFADGGWNKACCDIKAKKAMKNYLKTMNNFSEILKNDGFLYIDKFKDSELNHREKLATIVVANRKEDLIFSSDRSNLNGIREVFMERSDGIKITSKISRATYDLSSLELKNLANKAGFSSFNGINDMMLEEKHFDVWLAQK